MSQQQNGDDCGVYLCLFAMAIFDLRGDPCFDTANDMFSFNNFRPRDADDFRADVNILIRKLSTLQLENGRASAAVGAGAELKKQHQKTSLVTKPGADPKEVWESPADGKKSSGGGKSVSWMMKGLSGLRTNDRMEHSNEDNEFLRFPSNFHADKGENNEEKKLNDDESDASSDTGDKCPAEEMFSNDDVFGIAPGQQAFAEEQTIDSKDEDEISKYPKWNDVKVTSSNFHVLFGESKICNFYQLKKEVKHVQSRMTEVLGKEQIQKKDIVEYFFGPASPLMKVLMVRTNTAYRTSLRYIITLLVAAAEGKTMKAMYSDSSFTDISQVMTRTDFVEYLEKLGGRKTLDREKRQSRRKFHFWEQFEQTANDLLAKLFITDFPKEHQGTASIFNSDLYLHSFLNKRC